ncbi:MAG TPA: PASTA domain-containing protein [Solirubrobacteraceae bacterium]|nr:PASTA domain-containing protein [Solirubrobacteraceae bacterium]
MAKRENGEVELQTRLAAISMRDDEPPDEPIRVQAGEKVTVHVRVRNQSKIVDEYILRVEGLKHGWWEIEPPELYLLPFGVGRRSSYEDEAAVTLKPPRSFQAAAGRWPIRVTATSKATGEIVASVALKLDVLPYPEVQLTVEPGCAEGRRHGEFILSVTNAGNDAIEVVLSGKPREDKCRVSFEPPGLALSAGQTKTANVTAEATPNLVGRPVEHLITLIALPFGSLPEPQPGLLSYLQKLLAPLTKGAKTAAGSDLKKAKQKVPTARIASVSKTLGLTRPSAAPGESTPATLPAAPRQEAEAAKPPSCTCTYRQRSLLPWWVGVLLALALVVFAYFLLQWLKRVPVPNVKGVYISQARDTVKKANLHGVEVTAVPPAWNQFATGRPGHAAVDLSAGDVFAENPKAGTKLAPKSSVRLITAVTSGTSRVPNLDGLATEPAEHVLSRAGLAIGNIQPYPAPKGEVIIRQAPRPGTPIRDPSHKIVDVWLGQEVVVPNLVGQPAAKAEQGLRSLGLILGTVRGGPPRFVKVPPVIAAQTPVADRTIQAGNDVNVRLGLPVPKLKGQHLLQARRILHAKGMWLGALTPANAPAADIVVSEKPGGGTVTLFGTHVALRLAAPPQKKTKKKGKSSAGAAKPVPSVAGATAAAAAAKIAKAGDKTRKTYAISAKVPAGRLLSTVPAAGAKVKKGKTITLVISAGYPEIAATKGRGIVALSGVTGKILSHLVSGPATASEPSWSPSGSSIAYVSGGRIMLTPASGPGGPRALTGVATFALPTFPSVPTAPAVIAAIEGAPGADKLCLLAVAHPRLSCAKASGWTLEGEITWSPKGTEILVGATKSGTLALLKFTSKVPFSTRAKDWGSGVVATPTMRSSGVRAAAFAPNGTRLALAEDLGAPFSLALVAPSDLMLTKADTFAAPSPACSVEWRADSREVLVQTSSALDCSASVGSVYVVDPAHPRALSLLATGVAGAAWQPLPGVG